jgi:hypothetical protein
MADPASLATISTLAGTVVGAVVGGAVQSWRDRQIRHNELQTRWDKTLLDGLADYLGVSDLALRALRRLHTVSLADPDRPILLKQADEAVESMHQKSNLISLLTGGRDHPMRVASRAMRDELFPLQHAAHADRVLDAEASERCLERWLSAREQLMRAAQSEYLRQ